MYVLPYYKVQASVFAIIVAIWAGTEKLQRLSWQPQQN